MIYVFGTVCLDRIRRVPALPKLGAYVEIEAETIALGGEAANTAAHLRRWNASLSLRGNALGHDADGQILMGLLAEHGLEYEPHAVLVKSTPVCDVYVTPDGERTMFGLGFTSMQAKPSPNYQGESGWFTTDANLPELAARYAEAAKAANISVYLMDLAPTPELLGPGSFWQSSTRWSGGRNDEAACRERVREVSETTGATAILTDSGRGFYVGTSSGSVRTYPPFPQVKQMDPTGSGDLFRAGVLFGLDQDWPLTDCLKFAAAAAALGAASIGAAEGPTLPEVEQHIAAHPDLAAHYV